MPRERVPDDVYRAWVDACDLWSYAAAARLAGLSLHAFRNVGTAWGVRPNARTCDAVLKRDRPAPERDSRRARNVPGRILAGGTAP